MMHSKIARRLGQGALISTLLLAGGKVFASETTTIGTVTASVDGQATTWYVLDFTSLDSASAQWMMTGEAGMRALVSAFESREVEAGKDASGMMQLAGEGSMLSLTFGFPGAATGLSFTLPAEGEDTASLLWVPVIGEYAGMFHLVDGSIEVERIEEAGAGRFRASGTFSGTLQNSDGDSRTLSAGRFEFERIEPFKP